MAEPQTPDKPAPAEEKLYTLSEVSQPAAAPSTRSTAAKRKPARRPRAAVRGRGKKAPAAAAAAPAAGARRRGRPRRAAGAATAAAGRGGRRGAAAGRRSAARGRAAAAPARPGPGRPRKATPAKRGPGRPPGRRTAAGRRPRAAAGRRSKTTGLLTLTSISKTTGISYPTLVRYVRLHSRQLPHEGKGRARRFHPEAVEEFRRLRQQSGRGGRRPGTARRGRPPKSAGISGRVESILAQRVRDLEKFQKAVEKRFGKLVKGLQSLR